MRSTKKERRQILSATIHPDYIVWLTETSKQNHIPKSRLLEQGIKLLQKHLKDKEKIKLEEEIRSGINTMLETKEDQEKLAESERDTRIDEELL